MSYSRIRRRWAVPAAVGAALSLVLFAGCSSTPAQPEPTAAPEEPGDAVTFEPVEIVFADYLAESTTFGTMIKFFQENVTERTGGAVTWDNYWAGALLGATEQLGGVRDGIADVALIHGGTFPSELPVAAWMQGFGLSLSGSPLHDFVANAAAISELSWTWEPLIEEYAANDLKPLMFNASMAFQAMCVPEVNSLAQFDGLNVRAAGIYQAAAVEALGGIPVTMSFNEIYEGLQRGAIDCALANPGSFAAGGWHEVAPNQLPISIVQGVTGYAMNLEFWDSLQPELQQILFEEANRAALQYVEIDSVAAVAQGELIADGTVVLNDAAELAPVLQEWQTQAVAGLVDTAPPGVTDPQAVIDLFLERQAHWTQVLVDLGYPVIGTAPDELEEFFASLGDVTIDEFWDIFYEEVIAPNPVN